MKKISRILSEKMLLAEAWSKQYILGLFIFNSIIVILLLLRSAGYFYPFFPLTINFIMFACFFLIIPLLGARSKTLILISVIFLIFTAFFKIFKIDIWAERTSIYFFQAFLLGIILFILENREQYQKED